jgi:hypothetical protein
MRRLVTVNMSAREFVIGRARVSHIGVSTIPLQGGRIWYVSLWPNLIGLYVGWFLR